MPHFDLVVDHQPLVSILNSYTLDMTKNPRLQRLKVKLGLYIFDAHWRKGKDHAIPDALSCAPVSDPSTEDVEDSAHLQAQIRCVPHHISTVVVSSDLALQRSSILPDPWLSVLREAASQDPQCLDLVGAVTNGFPSNTSTLTWPTTGDCSMRSVQMMASYYQDPVLSFLRRSGSMS